MQTYIVIASGRILNVSTVHLCFSFFPKRTKCKGQRPASATFAECLQRSSEVGIVASHVGVVVTVRVLPQVNKQMAKFVFPQPSHPRSQKPFTNPIARLAEQVTCAYLCVIFKLKGRVQANLPKE